MKYITFGPENNKYPVCLLVKSLRRNDLLSYVEGMEHDVVAYALPTTKAPKKAEMLEYLDKLLPTLCSLKTDYILVTDSAYFKTLTGVQQADRFSGYVLPCKLKDYEHFHVIYLPAPSAILYNPANKTKLQAGRKALIDFVQGRYVAPGSEIITFEAYPHSVEEIGQWLEKLLDVPLAIDIETKTLKHFSAGIGTMTLCWSQHEGIAFAVDKDHTPEEARQIRALLKAFFEARIAKTLYHRAWFDVYILVYQLFMKDVLDTEGLLYGLEIMLRSFEDTQLTRYLATNSCAGNKLSLKDAAQEFAGNYAVDVKNIDEVPLNHLLRYNLVDGLSTWYVYNTHFPRMVGDQQVDIYENLFKPCMYDIIQMQLTGLPINMEEVLKGKAIMQGYQDAAEAIVRASPYCARMDAYIARQWTLKRNSELKVKRVTEAECPDHLNLNSPPQLQIFLHEILKLPVVEETDTGQPATGMDAIEALIHHAQTDQEREVLQALIDYKQVNKILTSFIPAFEQAFKAPDGGHYLYGNFNLGGTLGGRLSSSDPNLQNLPATGSKYAKAVKKMFMAIAGKLFVGLDFNSLEDMISALTTKDPNKLKVYTDGYDGHCLRAYAYFGDQMPDIDPTQVDSINSIADKYKPLRQDSKAPTFALTYQGTWRTLVSNCGFSEEKAKSIETRYHEMYAVSDKWVQDRLKIAEKVGYVTVAFGLRLRTPMMQQCAMGLRATPYEAVAESRTAGNAMGQSYCMLNSRAAMAFMRKVRKHPEYRLRIRICAQIHDAMYFIVDNDADLLAWMNQHLVEEVKWQELPEIRHPTVHLGGALSVFYPTWNDELTIPNGAGSAQILQLAKEHIANAKR